MTKISNDFLTTIVDNIIKKSKVEQFVETGTYHGNSIPWALDRFKKIHTIEIREDYHTNVKEKYKNTDVNFLLGDSRECLSKINLSTPTIFWLDAHAGGGKFSEIDDCPLIEELKIIVQSGQNHFILIDDAYAFCYPLSTPYDYKCWPTLNDIFDILGRKFYIVLKNDILICVPYTDKEAYQQIFSKHE